MAEKNVQNDFSKGNIPAVVMRMALPLIAAQLVNVLYNVVDRIYIGHIPNVGSMALTGVGIALPVISILSAFAGLFGQGGAPLCSMARGRGDNDEASRVMGNAFSMLLVSSVALGLLTWAFLDPVITVFAAGKEASSYAREYLGISAADDLADAIIEAGMQSRAQLFIMQMQDYLRLGKEARMNEPGRLLPSNWRWRMLPGAANDVLAAKIAGLTARANRV